MVLDGNDFLAQLLETFRGEAQEHLSAIAAGLIALEKDDIRPEDYHVTVEQVFRETHSLKGAARAVGLVDIETLCQHQESVFSAVKKGTLQLKPEDFDLFHKVILTLERLLAKEQGVKVTDLIQQLRAILTVSKSAGETSSFKPPSPVIRENPPIDIVPPSENREPAPAPPQEPPTPVPDPIPTAVEPDPVSTPSRQEDAPVMHLPDEQKTDTTTTPPQPKGGGVVKISSERLENLFARADDLMGARLAAGQRSSSLRDLLQNFMSWRWAWSQITTDMEHLRTDTGKQQNGSQVTQNAETERILTFLDYNRTFIKNLESEIAIISRAATRDQYMLDTATTELIDEIKQVILVPASSILDFYPRAARDLAREVGKDVDVLISGADIEIDRRILEEIRDPLLHIIRNSIDHGIELPDVRVAKGKSARGQIRIIVTHVRGHQAEIHISDDGAGIDGDAVRSAALAKGLISNEEIARMDTNQILRLIFKSGLSTRKSISTVSGRGLGLAIAHEKVEQIGGSIGLESSSKGTTFILILPLTLATFRGIRIYTNNQPFFIPLRSIDRVLQITRNEIKTIENRTIIEIDNEPVAVVRLAQVLGLAEDPSNDTDRLQIILVSASGIRFGLLVDRITGAQEIVVKNLGSQLKRVRHISGASILGDGMIVPVINCEDLAATISGMEHMPGIGPAQVATTGQRRIMVVEDSITSRMLLKNILEGAGYLVETAVDGVDAMTKLKVNSVDIVVSDVDMPRMNGFVLTEKIRSDPDLSETPVILVTSLDSREDREHGITVGANAYIVKSSFDQSNLLEVISRYIIQV